MVTNVWYFRALNLGSIQSSSEPGLSKAERDKFVSHFLDNAGQQASGEGTRVGEICISIFSSFGMTTHKVALCE